MNALAQIPDWFGEAVMAVVAGVLGFFAKSLWEALRTRRHRQSERITALREFKRLLEDSKSVFRSQNYMARRLLSRLRQKYPAQVEEGLGFDETFYRLLAKMDDEERELQSLIRSTTLNSMRNLNEALRQWLREHQEFRTPMKAGSQVHFAEDLQQLELHLNQWFDKYEAVIPGNEQRSLVYLADEKQHGFGFPNRIASSVEGVIAELS